jgi:hypothetical protein
MIIPFDDIKEQNAILIKTDWNASLAMCPENPE